MRRAALLLLVLVPVVSSAPAAAATDACPAAVPVAGFTDVTGLAPEAVEAISCVALYDIARGSSATTFAPGEAVQRGQMALFLTRQLGVHGVTLPPAPTLSAFTDLGGVPADARTAILQLVSLGITTGTSSTTFDPYGVVSRWQMAVFLTRTLIAAGTAVPPGSGPEAFADLGGLPAYVVQAINGLVELGVARGTTDTTFSPEEPVSRWQMAVFLARVLAAGGVTPGEFGVVYAFDKSANTLGFAALDGTRSTSGLSFANAVTRWRVDGSVATAATFETALTLGDLVGWRAERGELWLSNRPFAGPPASRTTAGLVTLRLAPGCPSATVNYLAKDLTVQLGIKTDSTGVVKFKVDGTGISAANRTLWEETVDAIVAGARQGTVSVSKVGADLVWAVVSG
jgi:hypothetical protein